MTLSKKNITRRLFTLLVTGSILFSSNFSTIQQPIKCVTTYSQQEHLSENALILPLAGSAYFAIYPEAVLQVFHQIKDAFNVSSLQHGFSELVLLIAAVGVKSSPTHTLEESPTLKTIQEIHHELFYFLRNSAHEALLILNNPHMIIPNYLNTFGEDYELAWIFDPHTRKIHYLTHNITRTLINHTTPITVSDLFSGSLINFLHTLGHVIDANQGVTSQIDRKALLNNYSIEIEATPAEKHELMSRMADIRADIFAIPVIRSFSTQQRESAISYYTTRWTNIFERDESGLSKVNLIYFTYQYFFWTQLGYTEITKEMNNHVVDKLINEYPDIHQKFERHLRFFSEYQTYLQPNPTWISHHRLATAT